MSDMKYIYEYYKDCIVDELRTSAFKNIEADKNNIVIKLGSENEQLLSQYPAPVEFSDIQPDLLNMKIKAGLDENKELVYGFLFTTGTINKKKINTPILYAPCEIVRDGVNLVVKITGELQLNVGLVSQLTDSESSVLQYQEILSAVPKLPMSEKDADEFLQVFNDWITVQANEQPPKHAVNKEQALILANIPKGTASILRDYDYMINKADGVSCNTCLEEVACDIDGAQFIPKKEEFLKFSECRCTGNHSEVSPSQARAIEAAETNTISAIQGGPGCGKSTVITALASELLANNKTVLIAGKMNEAVDVVAKKIYRRALPIPYARVGNKNMKKELANAIEDVLNSGYTHRNVTSKEFLDTLNKARSLEKELQQLFYSEGIKNKIKRFIKKQQYKTLEFQVTHVDYFQQMAWYLCDVLGTKLAHGVRTYRRQLLSIARALREDKPIPFFEELQETVPCWITTIRDAGTTIPCKEGMFDYVIIDEASQCDLASVMPVLFRARNAVIVGDDKQLKFVSFAHAQTNNNRMQAVIDKVGGKEALKVLDNRANSLYDFAKYYTTADGVVMLKEHYRSTRALMSFANRNFYGNQLTFENEGHPDQLRFERVDIKASDSMKGKTINPVEANILVDDLKKAIAENLVGTVGIVTPFRAQAELISQLITKEISPEDIAEHDILVGTAHAFQGNERRTMYASWAVNYDTPAQVFAFVNEPHLFNVAITRAQSVMINYYSIDPKDMPNGYLKNYILGR